MYSAFYSLSVFKAFYNRSLFSSTGRYLRASLFSIQSSLISDLPPARQRRFRHHAIQVHVRAVEATDDSWRPAQDSAHSPNTPLCWQTLSRDSIRSELHPCDRYRLLQSLRSSQLQTYELARRVAFPYLV